MEEYNAISLDTICAALAGAMGIEKPREAAAANAALTALVEESFGGEKADRVFMYNPDAVAQWIDERYGRLMGEVKRLNLLEVPLKTVMPSVTPVCFGTMYTGAQPEVHGIRRYEKPVIKIDSLFDAAIRAGKRVAIVAESNCSMSKIYLEREMDYFIYDTIAEVNAKAVELILEDKHDLICVYNGNYDSVMHKTGPESLEALSELRNNAAAFGMFVELIRRHWQDHNVLYGFAMDHGCHEIDGGCGSHGLDMPEDLNIRHYYGTIKRQ